MSWRRNFADYQNELSQKSADKLIDNFVKLYEQAASEMIPMFLKVYEEAWDVAGIKKLAPETLYHLDSYWALLDASRQRAEVLGNDIILMINDQFHVMYTDVFEGITPGGIEIPCTFSSEAIQTVIDGVWGGDQKNWRERVWVSMTCLWDGLTGSLMEAIIKHHTENKLQATLQKEFEKNCKLLNTKISIDRARIQSKAALSRQVIARKMAQSSSVNTAAYVMTYGDESEISELTEEDVAAVNILSDRASTFRLGGIVGDAMDLANQRVLWVCEGDDPCEDCLEEDGCIMTIAEAELVPYPLHPNCLCVLEWEEDDEDGDGDYDEEDYNWDLPDGGKDAGGGDDFMDMIGFFEG